MSNGQNKHEKVFFTPKLDNAQKKASRIFKIEICLPNSLGNISQRTFLDKIISYEPLIRCIVSSENSTNDNTVKIFKIFIDVANTHTNKWLAQRVYRFFQRTLNKLIRETVVGNLEPDQYQESKCWIKIIKPDREERAIKWATNEFDACFTAHYEITQFSEKYKKHYFGN